MTGCSRVPAAQDDPELVSTARTPRCETPSPSHSELANSFPVISDTVRHLKLAGDKYLKNLSRQFSTFVISNLRHMQFPSPLSKKKEIKQMGCVKISKYANVAVLLLSSHAHLSLMRCEQLCSLLIYTDGLRVGLGQPTRLLGAQQYRET